MFGKLFDSKPATKNRSRIDPGTATLIKAIRERSQDDPLLGAKLGSKEVLRCLRQRIKDAQGVHVESQLCALGALAGYACQASLRAQALTKGLPETAAFRTVATREGKRYFFGDPLKHALAGAPNSVWAVAADAAQTGVEAQPDVDELIQYSASLLGSERFGIPRVPERHQPKDTPANYLKTLWPALFPTVKLFCPNPADWPVLYSLAIQEAIRAGSEVINPGVAFCLVMESAIPMSKVDLANP